MGKLLRNIALFSLPLVGLLIWMLASEPDTAYKYEMVQKDCRSGSWIYQRLYESHAPIDIAFVGTSKTMCDVNDALLEQKVDSIAGKKFHIANLGVCRIGENLHYLIARDLLAHKKPKYLILEVSTDLPSHSHLNFPYVAETGDALAAPLILNTDYIGDIVALTWNRLVYHREHALGIPRSFEKILTDSLHSFLVVGQDGAADSAQMARVKEKRLKTLTDQLPTGFAGWVNSLESRHPKHYLNLIQDLCKAHGSQLIFLYLPVYGTASTRPQQIEFLETLGPVWLPPDSVFGNPKLYFDDSHLNMAGAAQLTDWLMEKVGGLDSE